MTALIPVEARDGTADDLPFVFNSWLKSYRASLPEMRSDDYFRLQHQRITWLLAHGGGGRIRILHPAGRPAVIAAWACLDEAPAVVHYVYSNRVEYRRRGFARRLLEGRSVCTHLTADGLALKRSLGLRFMPHLLDA